MRRILRAALPLAIFLLLTVCLCSCTRAQTGSFTVVRGDEYSPYRTYGAAILPGFTITDGSLYQAVTAGGAAAAFDYQADEMTENGCFWYPQFQASVVIAVDRDKTDSAVSGWRDLAEIPDNVGLDDRVYLGEYLAAMTYGLTGELRDLSAACSLLRAVYASGRLDTSGAGRPVWICFDYEAAACAAQGRNIEIVVPAEGTLTFTSGIVSRSPLAGLSGFDLPSDAAVRPSARAGLFPDDSEYSRAAVLSDFTDIDRLLTNATRQYRRGVLRDKLFSSADGREHIILGIVFMCFAAAWLSSALYRIGEKRMRRITSTAVAADCAWVLLRTFKYLLTPFSAWSAVCWYGYYIFQLGLPLLFLLMAHMTARPQSDKRPPVYWFVLAFFDLALLAVIFTNSIHHLAFKFDPGSLYWEDTYSYGVVPYIAAAASAVPVFSSLIMLAGKARKALRGHAHAIPLILVIAMTFYSVLYAVGVPLIRHSDITMVMSVFFILCMESAFSTGLIPRNSRYGRFFRVCPRGMQLLDDRGEAVLFSEGSVPLDKAEYQKLLAGIPAPVVRGPDAVLYGLPVRGGTAVWQEDVSRINTISRELDERADALRRMNSVLSNQRSLLGNAAREKTRLALLEALDDELDEQIGALTALLRSYPEDESLRRSRAARAAVMLCYIKRRSALFFNENERALLPAEELDVYIRELSSLVGATGLNCSVSVPLNRAVQAHRATLFYVFMYTVLTLAIDADVRTVLGRLACENGVISMRLMPSGELPARLPERLAQQIAQAGGTFSVGEGLDAQSFSLSFAQGGERS